MGGAELKGGKRGGREQEEQVERGVEGWRRKERKGERRGEIRDEKARLRWKEVQSALGGSGLVSSSPTAPTDVTACAVKAFSRD